MLLTTTSLRVFLWIFLAISILKVTLKSVCTTPWEAFVDSINAMGIWFNASLLVLASAAPSVIETPLVKVFSAKTHTWITWIAIFFANFFFLLFPYYLYKLIPYLQEQHPDLIPFLHSVFG